jgi:alanyl-tRNA synthetase
MKRDPRIPSYSAAELRSRFIAFFEARDHTAVPSASLIPAGDATLLFTNSGMVQFKELFSGAETRSYTRAVDYQRCLRVAGKHNDFEEVGRTPRHHTLFEMLGSWSFGDYFKRDAILWAWEFLTVELGIPADRLAATIYSDDEEAAAIWRDEIKLPPERLARWGDVAKGDDANFWRMAETGPCGPCSEIHFDRGVELSCGNDCVPDHSEQCPRWLEIWNLVFMQYEQHADGRRTELPFKSVDTGMGLERLASVSQQVLSNYDTDLFVPIHGLLRKITGHDTTSFEKQRFSYQVIADHARAVTFLLADGVRPGNEGRGYVLRRIIRRAVRHGRLLGIERSFLPEVARAVIGIMSEAYPYLRESEGVIVDSLEREEAQFARTLDGGSTLLAAALAPLAKGVTTVGVRPDQLPDGAPRLDGEVAFKLHDTFGFPIDLTVELAAERGVAVDRTGFDAALAEQRQRSRGGKKAELAEHAASLAQLEELLRAVGETEFTGYERLEGGATVKAILAETGATERAKAGNVRIVVDRTPFYAERGGQVGDQGDLIGEDGRAIGRITDTQRPVGAMTLHDTELDAPIAVGDRVTMRVDAPRRAATVRNHTATHLLHRAIRIVAGAEAKQRGSLVHPDYLRFDYPLDRALTREERDAVESEVQRAIRSNIPIVASQMSMKEAVDAGADAFFDEKYGERVRTIRMADYSHELCGGTHCSATGEVGSFVITSDRSIGSGLRRIEALSGPVADEYLRARVKSVEAAAELLGLQDQDLLTQKISQIQAELKDAKRRAREGGARRIDPAALVATATSAPAGHRVLLAIVEVEGVEELKDLSNQLRKKMGPGVIALVRPGGAPDILVVVEGVDAALANAGSIVSAGATAIGGRGGGKPNMGQGRGAEGGDAALAIQAMAAALGLARSGADA